MTAHPELKENLKSARINPEVKQCKAHEQAYETTGITCRVEHGEIE
jgi:hypothetical protein